MIFSTTEKQLSRYETIISPYREFFGRSLPAEKQYWTLSAQCSEDGGLISESEFNQILEEGLIQPDQFHGVDTDREAVIQNKKIGFGNFHHGDIYSVMANFRGLNPGVVNLDLLRTFETEKELIKKMFLLLSGYTDFIFNINVLFSSHRVSYRDPQDILRVLGSDPDFYRTFTKYDWGRHLVVYPYKGIGPRTKMVSLTFRK